MPKATVKRLSDLLLALVPLPLAAPFLLLSALLIWLDPPGPILYRSPRLGWGCPPLAM